jgi:hypothetical protein
MSGTERRAARLARWYPASWRARYGDEFSALLEADMDERPRSISRAIDVARGGLVVRLGHAGLIRSSTLDRDAQVRACLGVLGCAATCFLVGGIAVWSQLTIGWQWAAPDSAGVRFAMFAMSATLPIMLLLALLAGAPIVGLAVRRSVLPSGNGLRRPLILMLTGLAVLAIGSCVFNHGWPGTGGHRWPAEGLVPGGIASAAWAATVSITSYWAHPAQLGTFPAIELGWMAAELVAIGCVLTGTAGIARRQTLPDRLLRWERWVGRVGAAVAVAFLGGGAAFAFTDDSGPRHLFAPGAIDLLELAVMALAAAIALGAARRLAPAASHARR